MISFIQLLVTKLVEIQAFFFVGANHKAKKALKGANGNENMLEYLYIKYIL